MKREQTLGVVGHVDHGKTALVEALTGTQTDRLPEERARGLSIVLGFAYLESDDSVIDLIDVPGHEDFVRAMISGATGFDGIVLVVAANEGIMPQTREHFAIARLLGIERGIIVISKSDLVAPERIMAVTKELLAFVGGTFLEQAPIFVASVKNAASIANLRAGLERLAELPIARAQTRDFHLPVDRVFAVSGFGVVATGTLRGGRIAAGDAVTILPGGREASIRGLERHHRAVIEAWPGQRVAVNLRGIERNDIERGDVIASRGLIEPTSLIDAELTLLDDVDKPLKNGARVRVLTGTTETLARVRLLEGEALAPGAMAFAQLRLESAIATVPGERYLVRAYSPMQTLGGGRVLDAHPERHMRFAPDVVESLKRRAAGDIEQVLADALARAGSAGLDCRELAANLGIGNERVAAALLALGGVPVAANRAVSASIFRALCEQTLARVDEFHAAHPHERGLSLRSLETELGVDQELARKIVATLADEARIEEARGAVWRAGFAPSVKLTDGDRRLLDSIETAFFRAGLDPPEPRMLLGSDRRAAGVYRLLLDGGRLVRLQTYARGTDIVIHADTLADVRRRLGERFPHPERFTVAEARDALRSTRKHVTPLMEHLDATGFTIRIGDLRQLRTP